MPYIEAFIHWQGDCRRIIIEGEIGNKAFEFLQDQLQEERELVNIAGIRPKVVQVGAEKEDFRDQRERARVTTEITDVLDEVNDISDNVDINDDIDELLTDDVNLVQEQTVMDFEMPFGKHRNKTLWQIACEDPKYLDWAAGEFDGDRDVDRMIKEAVKIPAISKKIDAAVFDE